MQLRSRSDRAARGAERRPGAVTGPYSLGAHVAVGLCVLPGRCCPDGSRSGPDSGLGSARPGVRGRTPVELRVLCLTRTRTRLRSERFRRDASGALGVGCRAAGGFAGGGCAFFGLRRSGGHYRGHRLRPRLPHSHEVARRPRRTAELPHPRQGQ
ncbi:hypothetical protein SDC9_102745 [bioreactor metagenome]|uniref:Uncharacterized protein n=1 Tax=bioreactor metagenome TaxID=1076179 RepID=A0A645AS90_9ZZZZ